MDHQALLETLIVYHEAFAEREVDRRLELLARSMTPNAEIWGPKRFFAGYEAISEKIAGFHRNWPACRLALTTGVNTFLNTAHLGCAIIGSDGIVRANGRSVIEFADDGRIQRVSPLWEPLPPLPGRVASTVCACSMCHRYLMTSCCALARRTCRRIQWPSSKCINWS